MKQMLHTDIDRLRKVIASDTPMCLGVAFTFVCGVRDEVTVGGEAFAVNRTYDGFRRASETAVVVADVRHAAKVRLYDSEDRVCGYALTNAVGRGVSVVLAYDGSYVTNTVYTMPNGGVLAVNLTRERARKELVTRRDCFFGGQSVYRYETGYDLLGRPTNAVDSARFVRAYGYNSRSELAAATVGTNRYGYAYDSIGNRLRAPRRSEHLELPCSQPVPGDLVHAMLPPAHGVRLSCRCLCCSFHRTRFPGAVGVFLPPPASPMGEAPVLLFPPSSFSLNSMACPSFLLTH